MLMASCVEAVYALDTSFAWQLPLLLSFAPFNEGQTRGYQFVGTGNAMGRPARSAAGHSQSTVPSVSHALW